MKRNRPDRYMRIGVVVTMLGFVLVIVSPFRSEAANWALWLVGMLFVLAGMIGTVFGPRKHRRSRPAEPRIPQARVHREPRR